MLSHPNRAKTAMGQPQESDRHARRASKWDVELSFDQQTLPALGSDLTGQSITVEADAPIAVGRNVKVLAASEFGSFTATGEVTRCSRYGNGHVMLIRFVNLTQRSVAVLFSYLATQMH